MDGGLDAPICSDARIFGAQSQYKRVFLRMVKILTLTTNDDLEDFPEDAEREAGAD